MSETDPSSLEVTPCRARCDLSDLYGERELAITQTPAQKREIQEVNRQRLNADLFTGRLEFESRPFAVDMQITNFCNMSCIMCYDGKNPPLEKMSRDLLELVAGEILPTVSTMIPFSGSEPLLLGWDLTRGLAMKFGIELDMVTNVQFLDEAKFKELEPLAARLCFSIDSHIPEIYEKIRLRSNPEKVFRNLPIAARLCSEHGILTIGNVVMMSNNAAWIPETVRYLGEAGVRVVHVLRYIHNLPHQRLLDPQVALSEEFLADLRDRTIEVARELKLHLIWDALGSEQHDFREETGDGSDDGRPPLKDCVSEDPWLWNLRHYVPGYCAQSVWRVKVAADSQIYPCCVADGGVLSYGRLFDQPFEEIWNGPNAQDLRRGMLTRDLPKLCRDCGFTKDVIGPEGYLPFLDSLRDEGGVAAPPGEIELLAPSHMERLHEAPTLRWTPAAEAVDRYVVAMSLGGNEDGGLLVELPPDCTELQIEERDWKALHPNMGYWWGVWGLPRDEDGYRVRSKDLRCLIRHEDIPRVPGSSLEY